MPSNKQRKNELEFIPGSGTQHVIGFFLDYTEHFILDVLMMNLDKCKIRRAQTQDRADLLRIAEKIWDGGDYLPHVLDRWLEEPWFFVCEYNGKAIACIKLTLFPDSVLWIEGLRVNPDYQGQGIATLLNKEIFRFSHTLKAKDSALSLEFCTYYKNVESLHLTRKLGFQDVAGFYKLEHVGLQKILKPEIISDYTMQIFVHYPHFLPLNWHVVHTVKAAFPYIKTHSQIFRTPNGLYLIGSEGERAITCLSRPHSGIIQDIPYFQYFFGPGKPLSLVLGSEFEKVLPILLAADFYFWDESAETTINMLVLRLSRLLPANETQSALP